MNISKISIRNFRCFEHLERVSLSSGINLLIGDNASGKTSLISACSYVCSSFFSGFSDENTKWESPSNNEFHREILEEGFVAPDNRVMISFCIGGIEELSDIELLIEKGSKKSSKPLKTGLKSLSQYSSSLQQTFFDGETKEQVKSLPLFSFYSTEDIHSNRKINDKKFKNYYQANSFGYYECLKGNGFLSYWLKRLMILVEGKKNDDEVEIVRNAIRTALGDGGCNIIQDIDIRPVKQEVYFILTDGREVTAQQLSDGYRRVVNIVVDLAERCVMLNRGIFGMDSCSMTQGCVLIDEIDMHLHPSLQATVLRSLRRTFPLLQIIATTHAPIVMSNVKTDDENSVFRLTYTEGHYLVETINTYGMDASTITEDILKQNPRAREVQEDLNNLFDLIDREEIAEARKKLDEIRDIQDLSELYRAEAMITFLDEEDN